MESYTYAQCMEITDNLCKKNLIEKSKIPMAYISMAIVAFLTFLILYKFREKAGLEDEFTGEFNKKKYVFYGLVASGLTVGGTYYLSKKYHYI